MHEAKTVHNQKCHGLCPASVILQDGQSVVFVIRRASPGTDDAFPHGMSLPYLSTTSADIVFQDYYHLR